MTPELGPPVEVLYPEASLCPLVVSSPHSGNIYPPSLLHELAVSPAQLRRLEDGCVDRLFAGAPALGAPLLRARFARAYIDPNRAAFELDAALFGGQLPDFVTTGSAKARAGLGTIPSRVGGHGIYRTRLSFAEAERRIDCAYRPYHRALQRLLAQARAEFGIALLLDCHSMPSATADGLFAEEGSIEFALGDCYGRSCAPVVVESAEALLRRRGFKVGRNRPYAGGFITARYGQPATGVHALQIEVRRDLFMDEHTLQPNRNLEELGYLVRDLMAELIEVTMVRLQAGRGGLARCSSAS